MLGSANATVGGIETQDANVICGNGAQGVLIEPGASGNQVLGNQIGVVGPSTEWALFPGRATVRRASRSSRPGQQMIHRASSMHRAT